MSADNYMAVKERDGFWFVWMVLGGYDEEDWEIPIARHIYYKTTDKLDALEWAHKFCSENVVEYGVHLLGADDE